MLAFRPAIVVEDSRMLTAEITAAVCAEVLSADHFSVSPELGLSWQSGREDLFWEPFLGRALDYPQTRDRAEFESWAVRLAGSIGEPLIAIRWEQRAGLVHVTRAIECYVQEGFDSGGGVFETREVRRWVRELVGTVELAGVRTAGRLRDELAGLVQQAVVGTSRLPLTSLESPLPSFTFGQLMYSFGARGLNERLVLDSTRSLRERAQLLEFFLRSHVSTEIERFGRSLADRKSCLALLSAVFNGASLSPYTEFVPRAIALLRSLTGNDPGTRADFIARLILLLDRHLVAYDLVKFHHRGANYPDALLLEELWAEFTAISAEHPELFQPGNTLRRRALRHAWMLRIEYAGWPAPDRPTSIGENARVMPFDRLPEQQIHAPSRRRRKLFANPDSFVPDLADLDCPSELLELGTAIFLDRPLGAAKAPAEPDRTPLLSHVLCSKSVIERRLRALLRQADRLPSPTSIDRWLELLDQLAIPGLSLRDAGSPPRPGVVSLHDAFQTADDWMLQRTTHSSLRDFAAAFAGSGALNLSDCQLLVPSGDSLAACDRDWKPMWELLPDYSEGYVCRGGIEVPRAGLTVRGLGNTRTLWPAIE